jgi:hypothetical protein
MKYPLILGCVLAAYSMNVSAQDEESAPDSGVVVERVEEGPAGDVITLKNGQVLQGFQVIRKTPSAYIFEILPPDGNGRGVELAIPRRQVLSIKYDDIDAIGSRAPSPLPVARPEPTWLRMQQVPGEALDRLNKDVSDPSLAEFKGKDIEFLMAEVAERADITIECDKVLEDLPSEERVWTFDVEPGTTVLGLLGDGLGKMSELDWLYCDGKILITTKESARERMSPVAQDKEAPAPSDEPPAETPAESNGSEQAADETPSGEPSDEGAANPGAADA